MSDASRFPDRERTFVSLYEATYADLLRFVQRRAGPGPAEDVVADTFMVVWRRLGELPQDQDDARAWAFGIARNILLNDYRGEQRRRALGVRLADTAALRSTTVESNGADTDLVLSAVDIARAWPRLSEVHQEAISLAAFEGLSAPQAAAVLGISPVAFRLRLSRARRTLRVQLDHLPPPPARPAPIPQRTATP